MKLLPIAVVAATLSMTAAVFAQSPPTAPATTRAPIPATPGKTFDLAWVGKMVRVSDPEIAPDGKSLVVVVSKPNYDEDLNESELALVDMATGATRYLTHARKTATFPRWSPKGDRLAFLAHDADKKNQIFVLDMTGGDAEQITKSPTSIQQFAWKPDGTAFAYVARDEASKKKGADKFDDAFHVGDNSYLEREEALPTHLWMMAADGSGEAKRLTSGSWSLPVPFPPAAPPSPIAFTPEGSKLIYVRAEDTYSGDSRMSTPQILDLATGKSEAITTHTMHASFPVPSPDGTYLAYLYPRDGVERSYDEIYVVKGLKGDGEDATRDIDRNLSRALWMPDGKTILTGGDDGATAGMWLQPIDGGKATRLDLGDVTPNPGNADVGKQGQIAFPGTEPHRPTEIYLIDSPGAKPRRLTMFNAAFDTLNQGRSEVVTWKSPDKAPKDWMEDGILTFPPDYAPGKKLPLVLYIHGGPTGNSKDTFSTFAQLIAAQGWLVFEPNYRGSDNEGQDFERAIVDDSGDGPGRDVLAGVEMLKQRGIVDENNIAVTGWSYGGYMTSWLIGHAQFWKAAIAGAPVTNLIDQYNLSDTNVSRAVAIGGSPYTGDWMKHWVEQSPITYYDRMKTPTLVLQDVGDYRVTITQGYELYHSLKDRGIETEFYAYPVGGHFPADPVRVRDVYRRWIEWLDQFLPHQAG